MVNLRKLDKICRKLNIHVYLAQELVYRPNKNLDWIVLNIETSLSLTGFINKLDNRKASDREIARSICHELGHFVLVSRTRKKKINYGIKTTAKNFDKLRAKFDIEELKAQAIEKELLKRLNYGKLGRYYRPNKDIVVWAKKNCKRIVDELLEGIK